MNEAVHLCTEIARDLTFQSYDGQPAIEGVVYQPLTKHRALEGWFMEYLRLDHGIVEGVPTPFEARQISLSQAVPGRVNAFHVHPRRIQDELWCVVQGALLVWLIDCRQGSPTLGARRNYILSGEAPAQLCIPSGVAHGYKAGDMGALLVYTMNSQFDLADPNEGRLPWDYFGAGLWEVDRG